MRSVIDLADLPHTKHAHEFVGSEHGGVPVSVILAHSAPGLGPASHRHPYAELFIVEAGQATFQVGENRVVVDSGHIVFGPPDIPHGFTNTGAEELRLTAIHCAPSFTTDWVAGPDAAWASPPRIPPTSPQAEGERE
jgi:quercetin dioxygenase-like cupin family protein